MLLFQFLLSVIIVLLQPFILLFQPLILPISAPHCPISAPVSVLVEAPPEVRVPEVCCVGLSARAVLPISNPSRHWLNVELCLVRLLVNMQEQDTQRTLSFIMKEKVVVEPNTTENIEVGLVEGLTYWPLKFKKKKNFFQVNFNHW